MAGAERLFERIAGWAREARANRLFAPALAGSLAVALIDQLAKAWIVRGLELPDRPGGRIELSGIFDLTYVQNYGASFGMLAGGAASRIVLSLISIGVVTALTAWLARIERRLTAAGVALIVGGAIGNLVDRASLGYVVDFLDFSGLYFPWVFNVADAAINIGVVLLLLDAWLTRGDSGAGRNRPKGA
jgi:signal peptidase II